MFNSAPECRNYVSVNWFSVDSNNGLSPGRRQAIIRTIKKHIVDKTSRSIFQWNFIWNSDIVIKWNTFEHIIHEMTAILSMGKWVNQCN